MQNLDFKFRQVGTAQNCCNCAGTAQNCAELRRTAQELRRNCTALHSFFSHVLLGFAVLGGFERGWVAGVERYSCRTAQELRRNCALGLRSRESA